MMAARDKAGKLLMTAQHFRFSGLSQAMKTEIETGTLGNIYHGRSWMLRRNGFVPSPTFVEKKHSGGGPCIDIGVHVLDLTLWLMGNPEPVAITRRVGGSIGPPARTVCSLETVRSDAGHLGCGGLCRGVCPI